MFTVGTLASWVQGEVIGDSARAVSGIANLNTAQLQDLSFLANPRYQNAFAKTQAGCVLVRAGQQPPHAACTLIVCEDPYVALAILAAKFYPPSIPACGIEPGAHVHPTAQIDPSAVVRTGAVVDAKAVVGARTCVGPQVYVGTQAVVGADVCLHAGAKIMERCTLGDRVIVHAGAVIGSDGFGFATDRQTGTHHKIPQVGIVALEDDVEIGANTTIDRATFGCTRIGAGTKIDNLVQIGHNVVLGSQCIVVSQSGIAGSSQLGRQVTIGAQGGIGGHVTITDRVMLAARAGVAQDVDKPGVYSGSPYLVPHREALKIAMAQKKVPELRHRVRELERQLKSMHVSSSST